MKKTPTVKVFCSHTKMMKIDELKKLVHPRNPNRHPRDQVKMMAHIITCNGWRSPITISNRCGLIIRGHGRLEGADYAGLKEAPVDYQDYETEADEIADMIADNRIQQQSVLDIDACLEMMSDFDIGEIGAEQFGFSMEDFDAYSCIPDMSDYSGHYKKKTDEDGDEPEEDEDRPSYDNQDFKGQVGLGQSSEKQKRGKLTFKCPKCGWNEV